MAACSEATGVDSLKKKHSEVDTRRIVVEMVTTDVTIPEAELPDEPLSNAGRIEPSWVNFDCPTLAFKKVVRLLREDGASRELGVERHHGKSREHLGDDGELKVQV